MAYKIPAYIHPYHTGKAPNPAGKVLYDFDWMHPTGITTARELHDTLYTQGKAVVFGEWDYQKWAAEGRKGTPRKSQYFVRSNVLIYDFDEGFPDVSNMSNVDAWEWLIERLTANPLIQDSAYLVIPSSGFTSAVHPDNPEGGSLLKHHIIFKLNGWIENWDEYKRIWWAFLAEVGFEYPADTATQHPAQPLYGTRFYRIAQDTQLSGYSSENELSLDYVSGLATPTDEKRPKTTTKRRPALSSSGEYAVMGIPLENRVQACIEHIQTQPHKLTYTQWFPLVKRVWQASAGDERVKDALIEWFNQWNEADDHKWYDDTGVSEPTVQINPDTLLKPYLIAHPELGQHVKGLINFLIPTHWNKEQDVTDGNVEIFTSQMTIAPMGTDKTGYAPIMASLMGNADVMLVLTPRIGLVNSLAETIKGRTDSKVWYFSSEGTNLGELTRKGKHIIVTTYNSLYRVLPDIEREGLRLFGVILEEFGQVGGLWDLMEEQGAKSYHKLRIAVRQARYAMINDATATETELHWFQDLRGEDIAIVSHNAVKHPKPELSIKKAHISRAVEEILPFMKAGKTIAVGCETTTMLKSVYRVIRAENSQTDIQVIMDLSKEDDIEVNAESMSAFIRNGNAEIGKYQVVLYTTKMGMGVSITQPIDRVFVLFNLNTLSPIDLVQMTARFRSTRGVTMYQLPQKASSKTPEEQIKEAIGREEANTKYLESIGIPLNQTSREFNEYNRLGKVNKALAQTMGVTLLQQALICNGYDPKNGYGDFEPYGETKKMLEKLSEKAKAARETLYESLKPISRNKHQRSEEMQAIADKQTLKEGVLSAAKFDVTSQIPATEGDVTHLLNELDKFRERNTADQFIDSKHRQVLITQIEEAQEKGVSDKQIDAWVSAIRRVTLFSLVAYVFPNPNEGCNWDNWDKFYREACMEAAIYNRVKDSDKKTWAEINTGDDKAYKVLRAFAALGGLKIRMKQVGARDNRVYVPYIANLEEFKRNAWARMHHRQTDYADLHNGEMTVIPSDYSIPMSWGEIMAAVIADWIDLKEILDNARLQGGMEYRAKLQAYLEHGYSLDEANDKATQDFKLKYGSYTPNPALMGAIELQM